MSRDDRDDRLCRALADRTRRSILDRLRHGAATTGELCAAYAALDRCTVMQHLRVLEDADLIIVKRAGRLRWNYLNAVPIQELADRWRSRYAAPALRQLGKLKRKLEV